MYPAEFQLQLIDESHVFCALPECEERCTCMPQGGYLISANFTAQVLLKKIYMGHSYWSAQQFLTNLIVIDWTPLGGVQLGEKRIFQLYHTCFEENRDSDTNKWNYEHVFLCQTQINIPSALIKQQTRTCCKHFFWQVSL